MPEVVLILVIALIVFGPRKLPELGKSLGQAMAQFRRASDDFKRTWEQEVELDKSRGDGSSTNYSYNAADAGEPYNPYSSDPDTGEPVAPQQLPAATAEKAVEPQPATSAEKKRWI
jgi:TatA/E family protein of Tat protein translocase